MQHSATRSLAPRSTAYAVIGFLFFAGAAFCDTLITQPEMLQLSVAQPVAEIQFRNSSSEESTLKFSVTRWQQEGEREWLTPSNKLIVLPERLVLEPGESGNVRVSLRLTGSFWDEEAFRIMVTETSRIPDVGSGHSGSSAARVSRPSSLPVFLLPPGKAKPRLAWSLDRKAAGGVVLRAVNNGRGHVQLNSANLLGPAGESIHKPNMSDILLPGGARSWELAPDAAAGPWHLVAETNAGPMRASFELEPDDSSVKALSFSQ